MSVYRPKGHPFYHFDFQIGGHRFSGTTRKGDRREAEQVERIEREKAARIVKARQAAKDGPLTIDLAADRYWTEAGQHKANAKDLERDLARIVEYFGPQRLLADIGDDDVAKLVAWRRGHRVVRHRKRKAKVQDPLITPSQVNRSTTEVLQRIFTRARDVWRVPLSNAPIWRNHMLPEPEERVRELRGDEDAALAASMDPDYDELRRFSLASGLRMNESLLRWSQVDFASATIIRAGKGGRPVRLPITPVMRHILIGRKGHHPEFVFTYVAKRAAKGKRIRKARYPITRSGLKTHWRRSKAKAGILDYRWHDNRHDFATKLLRATGNLKLVQRALNHRKIETTTKYAHVLDDELRAGMVRAEEGKESRTAPRTNKGKVA